MNDKDRAELDRILTLDKDLAEYLHEVNELYDNGETEHSDFLLNKFMISIEFCNRRCDIHLNRMDTYGAFCLFLQQAAEYLQQ